MTKINKILPKIKQNHYIKLEIFLINLKEKHYKNLKPNFLN